MEMSTRRKNIAACVYADEGTEDVDQVIESLSCVLYSKTDSTFSNVIVRKIDAAEVVTLSWTEGTVLFVMPGGRDLPYLRKLKGQANKIIREYVENGGKYLGLCAGGYYGARKVEFMKGTSMEVCGERELCFFPGIAKGIVFDGFDYSSRGSRVVSLRLHESIGELAQHDTVSVYYNGGCEFVCDQQVERRNDYRVLASYADFQDGFVHVAIVRCAVGKGVAILSGVHPEKTASMLVSGGSHKHEQEMKIGEEKRKVFWNRLLQILIESK